MSRGPGRAERKTISLVELMRLYPDDAVAGAWLAARRWREGVRCPHCGSAHVQSGASHPTMPYRCRERACRKRFSVRTGTVMESSNLGYQIWVLAVYLLTTNLKGVSSLKLHRDLGITQKSAWHLAHRIRHAWRQEGETWFVGPVEVDETYMGGKERNKHADKKLRAGRGAVGKTAVVGARDRATDAVTAFVFRTTDKGSLQGFVRDHVEPGATVYTDDAAAYKGLTGFLHEAVRHSVGEYVRGLAHTNGIESFWAMLKRAYKGVYHKMSVKHLDRYVSEFCGRHNIRDADTIDQMASVVDGMVGKRLRYADLIADREFAGQGSRC